MITHYHAEGVLAVDTHYLRPRLDASHLMIRDGLAAIIDCGTSFSIPHILDGLTASGLTTNDVQFVFITHVHLDHAGGAGQLMQALPQAELLVHPRGARHLIDPTKLWAGATAVYGEEAMGRLYGEMVAVPADRVVETKDGDTFQLGSARFEVLHTPGHAKHHHALWEPTTRSIFTGDTFGLAYPRYSTDKGPFIFPTTTPVHFDPQAMRSSIERFINLEPRAAFLTHYGRIQNIKRLGKTLLQRLDEHVEIAESAKSLKGTKRHQAIKAKLKETLLNSLFSHGILEDPTLSLEWWETDLELNAQGLSHWLETQG
ncbi:MAG: MBL fold metallo-hydrolase [Myxococcota bacterium]|nr:MBL fold metallo-hydrolase [Myxococcota bacterium]